MEPPNGNKTYRVEFVKPGQVGNPRAYWSPLPVDQMVWIAATANPDGDPALVAERVFDQLGTHDRTVPVFTLLPLAVWAAQHGAPRALLSQRNAHITWARSLR